MAPLGDRPSRLTLTPALPAAGITGIFETFPEHSAAYPYAKGSKTLALWVGENRANFRLRGRTTERGRSIVGRIIYARALQIAEYVPRRCVGTIDAR